MVMKNVILVVLALLVASKSQAQVCAVQATKMNVAYVGIDNPLRIVAEGHTCDEIEVWTNNGEIVKNEGCSYVYRPEKEKFDTKIVVSLRKNGKLIYVDSIGYRARNIPNAEIREDREWGKMRQSTLKAQTTLNISFPYFEFDHRFIISSFQFGIYRCGEEVFSKKNSGPAFDKEVLKAIRTIKVGDLVFIDDLKVVDKDGVPRNLAPTYFIVAPN